MNFISNIIRGMFDFLMQKKIERFLIISVFIISGLIVSSQFGMVFDSLKPYFTDIDAFEGRYINDIDSLIKEGTITLQLINLNADKDIKIMENGKEISVFDKNKIIISVKNDSIIEIDARKIKSPVKVKFIEKSDNVKNDEINKEIILNSDIKIISRIKLK